MIKRMSLGLALLVSALPALAQWELDNKRSNIYFISVKNVSVAEIHHFDNLLGFIGKDGGIRLSVDLNSVETLVPIRNERMREMLFDTAVFPTATVNARVDPVILSQVQEGVTISSEVPVTLSLHGAEHTLSVPVTVFSDGGSLRVMTAHPLLLRAEDFGLAPGVEALRAVAELSSISTVVPVSFNLVFSGVK